MSDFDFSTNRLEFSKHDVNCRYDNSGYVPTLKIHDFDFDCDGGHDATLLLEKVGHKFRYTYTYFRKTGDCETGIYNDEEMEESGTCDRIYAKKFPYVAEALEFIFKSGHRF